MTLFPQRETLIDHPWLQVPAAFRARPRRLGWLPATDLIALCMLLALALGHH